ncbi:hypothetical protein HS088_TW08G00921 [Tripterygium wilfordii]|uniref:Proteasome subunit beta n=1 Tax=Tripterygium wilfordii TaxID=458696 RepID=A0A7J7DD80_TRIWF|nr:hypothetical protein HS088_TW08G00921 [Tripterygium wilfordii]
MTKQQANWSPYDNNGGSVVAIAGADYCVIAADTRMSTGYSILTREYSKICQLADKSFLASSGFQADVRALQKQLAARHLIYQHQHNKQMSCPAMGQLLSNTLYYKRFFPYYAFNVLGGLDNEGKGCVFTYDAVGSYERVGYSSQGSGSTLIMPFLDNQLKSPSPLLLPAQDAVTPLSEAEAVDLVKTVFASATERDIYTVSLFSFVSCLYSTVFGIHCLSKNLEPWDILSSLLYMIMSCVISLSPHPFHILISLIHNEILFLSLNVTDSIHAVVTKLF